MTERAPKESLVKLADRFAEIYGETFTSMILDAELWDAWIESWSIGIAGVTEEQIIAALDRCKGRFEYPPSPSAFKSLCPAPESPARKVMLDAPYKHKEDRAWALKPRSQEAVDLMFTDPPMTREIAIATRDGYISGHMWVPENKRKIK